MPATLDDPTQPPHYRPEIMVPMLEPLTVLLKDGETTATIYPISTSEQLPIGLLAFLCDEFNMEIERGDTYPLFDTLHIDTFQNYWFGSFAGVMLLGDSPTIQQSRQWEKECLGTFYIKPNYPGRCSHICTGGFLVNAGIRGKGIGRTLAECYIDWAPKLGYSYSVFNLVFDTNIAARRILETLAFKRIGRVQGAGILKGHESAVDAIIYGRDLMENQEDVLELRFDKIKFYLETGRYPPHSDRQEKSRLRSSAAHYKLKNGTLMLKDREVVSDPERQLQIVNEFHQKAHAGINKTTSLIAERYHWTRIKETVSLAIRNCPECRETTRPPTKRQRIEESPAHQSDNSNNNNSRYNSVHRNFTPSSSSNPTSVAAIAASMMVAASSSPVSQAQGLSPYQQQASIDNNLLPENMEQSRLHSLSGLASQVQEQEQRQQTTPLSSQGQSNMSDSAASIAARVVAQMSQQQQQQQPFRQGQNSTDIYMSRPADQASKSASELKENSLHSTVQSSANSADNDIPVDPQIESAFEVHVNGNSEVVEAAAAAAAAVAAAAATEEDQVSKLSSIQQPQSASSSDPTGSSSSVTSNSNAIMNTETADEYNPDLQSPRQPSQDDVEDSEEVALHQDFWKATAAAVAAAVQDDQRQQEESVTEEQEVDSSNKSDKNEEEEVNGVVITGADKLTVDIDAATIKQASEEEAAHNAENNSTNHLGIDISNTGVSDQPSDQSQDAVSQSDAQIVAAAVIANSENMDLDEQLINQSNNN